VLFDDSQLLMDFPPRFLQLGSYSLTGYLSPTVLRRSVPLPLLHTATEGAAQPQPPDVPSGEVTAELNSAVWSRARVGVLTKFFEERNFGHFVIDGLHALYYAQWLHGFGSDAPATMRDVQVVLHSSYGVDGAALAGPARKFRREFWPAFSRYHVQTAVSDDNTAEAGEESDHAHSVPPLPPVLCFRNLIAGMGGLSIQHFGEGVAITGTRFRDFLRHGFGLPAFGSDTPLRRHRIVLARKASLDTVTATAAAGAGGDAGKRRRRGRHFTNHEQLLRGLRAALASASVVVEEFVPEPMSVKQQLLTMSSTTVFVSPPGGGSLVALFMPPGNAAGGGFGGVGSYCCHC
jgi:hypothetical protein